MKRFSQSLILAIGVVALYGCAARSVTPMRMAQEGDEALTCTELNQQLSANAVAAKNFLHKDKNVERANTAKVVGSAIPWVGILFAISADLSNAEQIEARAILDRNERLTLLSKNRGCTE